MTTNKIAGLSLFLLTFLVLCVGHSHATLYDRGSGLIYDDVLNVTWLQDASYSRTSGASEFGKMNWEDATNWVSQLEYEYSLTGMVFNDWRLPTTIDDPSSLGYDTSGMSSELSYMYYVNLGYAPNYTHNRFDPAPISDDYNPFINLIYRGYWSGTLAGGTNGAWVVHYHFGSQEIDGTTDELRPWAVRDGDVLASGDGTLSVPEPSVSWLLATGLLLLVGIIRFTERHRRKTHI